MIRKETAQGRTAPLHKDVLLDEENGGKKQYYDYEGFISGIIVKKLCSIPSTE